MVCKNKPIFQEYIEFHNKYTKLYGDKTIILMQVGGFLRSTVVIMIKIILDQNQII